MKYFLETNPVPIIQEQLEMLEKHWEEACLFKGEDLHPDWKVYSQLHDRKRLAVITARDKEEVIQGYSINIMSRHLHYRFNYAVNDLIYLTEKCRGHAVPLLRNTERILKAKGIKYFSISVKPHIDYRPVLERMGYKLLEYQYFRRL